MNETARMPTRPSDEQLVSMVANPFLRGHAEHVSAGTVAIESERAIAEAQGKLVIAKKFPRDETRCYSRIMDSCKRAALAEVAFYTYKRGGQKVSGPSIRLAEELARCWTNIEYGLRELSRRHGESEMEAFAWDNEENVISSHRFTVRHLRDKKDGAEALDSERDIFEMTANQGARRMRARLLAILPAWYVDAAVEQCQRTLSGDTTVPMADRLRLMIEAFAKISVTADMIVGRLGHPIDKTTPDELTELRGVMTSLKEGASKVADWFSAGGTAFPTASKAPAEAKQAPTQSANAASDKPAGTTAQGTAPDPAATSAHGATQASFEAYGCDEIGEMAMIAGEPAHFTDPAAFAEWLANRWLSSGNREALWENNIEGIGDARACSPEAAAILDQIEKGGAAPAQTASEAPGGDADTDPELDTPPDALIVAIPTDRSGSKDSKAYVAAVRDALKTIGSDQMDTWIEANRPNYEGLPNTRRLEVKKAIADRKAELGMGAVPAADKAPVNETVEQKPDRDRTIADDIIGQITACRTMADLSVLPQNAAIKAFGERIRRERPELRAELDAAFEEAKAALTGKGN